MLVQGKAFWKQKETREESGLKQEGVGEVLAVEMRLRSKEKLSDSTSHHGVWGGSFPSSSTNINIPVSF